jgi:hypothetical protein
LVFGLPKQKGICRKAFLKNMSGRGRKPQHVLRTHKLMVEDIFFGVGKGRQRQGTPLAEGKEIT